MKHKEEDVQRLIDAAVRLNKQSRKFNWNLSSEGVAINLAADYFITDPLEELKRTGCVMDEDEMRTVMFNLRAGDSYTKAILAACEKKAGEVFK
jgi:hypothetical protein